MDNDMREIWAEARNSAYTILDSEFRRVMHQAPGYGVTTQTNVPDSSILRWVYPKSQHGTIGDEG